MHALPEHFALKPDWWVDRINLLLGEWRYSPSLNLQEAYDRAWDLLPCTGYAGFRPCANCSELGFPCGSRERPCMVESAYSAKGYPLRYAIIYPDGERKEIALPLISDDYGYRWSAESYSQKKVVEPSDEYYCDGIHPSYHL